MTITLTSLANPRYGNSTQDGSRYTADIQWSVTNSVAETNLLKIDLEPHIQAAIAGIEAGEFGAIGAYVSPADITGEQALANVRAKRNQLLQTVVDPVVTNPLRWADLTSEQQTEVANYRTALLNITTDFPNVTYTFNEETKQYEEINITWPVKPVVLGA